MSIQKTQHIICIAVGLCTLYLTLRLESLRDDIGAMLSWGVFVILTVLYQGLYLKRSTSFLVMLEWMIGIMTLCFIVVFPYLTTTMPWEKFLEAVKIIAVLAGCYVIDRCWTMVYTKKQAG